MVVNEITTSTAFTKDRRLDHCQAKLNREDQAANIVHILANITHIEHNTALKNLQMR